jgi:DNA (cytosine-5)-methyltransferase 1
MGYHRAGYEVTGIDIDPMPRYPFEFIQSDALEYLAEHGHEYDAIHASPPCQRYSQMSACRPGLADDYPDLISPTRDLLKATGLPYVIENVPGSPLIDPTVLCGSHFNLTADWPGHGTFGLRRHRLFETNFRLRDPGPHDHSLYALPVYGNSAGENRPMFRGKGLAQACRDVMGIDWMRRDELAEALPPAYTRYVGACMLALMSRPESLSDFLRLRYLRAA